MMICPAQNAYFHVIESTAPVRIRCHGKPEWASIQRAVLSNHFTVEWMTVLAAANVQTAEWQGKPTLDILWVMLAYN